MSREIIAELQNLESSKSFRTLFYRHGFALTAYLTLSGFYLLFIDQLNKVDMFSLLYHILLGFLFVVPCVMFVFRHLQYRKLFPHSSYEAVALLSASTMLATLVSGVWLTFSGVTGYYWLWLLHTIVSGLCVVALLWYVWLTLGYFARGVNDPARAYIHKVVKKVVAQVALVTLVLVVLTVVPGLLYKDMDPHKSVPDYSYDLVSKRPFAPSKLETESGSFYKEELFMNSKSCGVSGCHPDTYKQWEDSAHYRTPNAVVSVVENLFIKETREGEFFGNRGHASIEEIRQQIDGKESFRFCAACHSPVALLSGNITPGEPEPTFEKFEGDSCIFCHVISKTGYGSGANTVAPPERYLFAHSKNAVGQFLYQTLVNSKPEFHKLTFARPFYKDSIYCAGCHTRLHFPSWEASTYNPHNNPDKKVESFTCQQCHMPQVPSTNDVSAVVKGTIADHRTLAANYVLPILYNLPEQKALTEKFLQDEKLALRIVAPPKVAPGTKVQLAVQVANVAVGHHFPAGPEGDLIEAWTEIIIKTDTGKTVLEYGVPDEDAYLNGSTTQIYRIQPYDDHGRALELDKHRSWRFASDELHVINPRTYDQYFVDVDVPNDAAAQRLEVSARFRYRKPNQPFTDFLFGKGKVMIPIVDMATFSGTIGLSQDAAEVEAAKGAYLASLNEKFMGLDQQTDAKVVEKMSGMSLEDSLIVSQVNDLVQAGKLKEALSRLNDISPLGKSLRNDPTKESAVMLSKLIDGLREAVKKEGLDPDRYYQEGPMSYK